SSLVQRTPISGAASGTPVPSLSLPRSVEALTPGPSPIPLPPFRERGDQTDLAGEASERWVSSPETAEPLATLDREVMRPGPSPTTESAPARPAPVAGSPSAPSLSSVQRSPEALSDASSQERRAPKVLPEGSVPLLTSPLSQQPPSEEGGTAAAPAEPGPVLSQPVAAAPEGQGHPAQGFNPGREGAAAASAPPSSPVQRTPIFGADSGTPVPPLSLPRSVEALTPGPSPIPLPPFRERGDQTDLAGEPGDGWVSAPEAAQPPATLDREVMRPVSSPIAESAPARPDSKPGVGTPQSTTASVPVA